MRPRPVILIVMGLVVLMALAYPYAAGLMQGRTCEYLWRSWLVEEGTMIIDLVKSAMLWVILLTASVAVLVIWGLWGQEYLWRWAARLPVPDWLSFSWPARLVERWLTNDYELQRQALANVPAWAKRIVDAGCGGAAYLDDREDAYRLGIDISAKRLAVARKHCSDVLQADVRSLDWSRIETDAVLCCEVIEHMTKEEGRALLENLIRYDVAVVTTPRDWINVRRNGFERHVSLWDMEDLQDYGFHLAGETETPPSNIYVRYASDYHHP